MPRDFKTYSKTKSTTNKTTNENTQNMNTNDYQNIIDKYKSMNQSDLMSNLIHEANRLKKEGQLTEENLINLKSTLSQFLNPEQITMLDELINAIK